MSTEAERFIDTLRDGDDLGLVPPTARVTLLAVASWMQEHPLVQHKHRRCFVGQKRLASRIGKTVRTVRAHLARMEDQRVIVRNRQAEPGVGRRGVCETILIVGFSDQAEIDAAWSRAEARQLACIKRQSTNEQSEAVTGPSGNSCHTYRETKVIPQIDQERGGGPSTGDQFKPIPSDFRQADVEWLSQAVPQRSLVIIVRWVWGLEQLHGPAAVTRALGRTRRHIEGGSIADPLAYIAASAADCDNQQGGFPSAFRRSLHDQPITASQPILQSISEFARPSAALLKALKEQ